MTEQNEPIIGYSGFDVFEECYGYNENACYIVSVSQIRKGGILAGGSSMV